MIKVELWRIFLALSFMLLDVFYRRFARMRPFDDGKVETRWRQKFFLESKAKKEEEICEM
jgi:hypothetical protein